MVKADSCALHTTENLCAQVHRLSMASAVRLRHTVDLTCVACIELWLILRRGILIPNKLEKVLVKNVP